eukprot:5693948-Alexandrium_andersonii.AAC.1
MPARSPTSVLDLSTQEHRAWHRMWTEAGTKYVFFDVLEHAAFADGIDVSDCERVVDSRQHTLEAHLD